MRAHVVAGRVDDHARTTRDPRAEEGLPTVVRDEAHIHAFALVGGAESERACSFPHLRLRQLPDRKEDSGQLALAEHVEHVRLVLGAIGTARDGATVRRVDDASVVAGRYEVEPERVGAFERGAELHRSVALDARVRRLS